MTDHDRTAARREITNALMNALERRHEVLDLIVEADDRPSAVDGIVELLGTSRLGAEAVIGVPCSHRRSMNLIRRPVSTGGVGMLRERTQLKHAHPRR